jgi:hypothetical protein
VKVLCPYIYKYSYRTHDTFRSTLEWAKQHSRRRVACCTLAMIVTESNLKLFARLFSLLLSAFSWFNNIKLKKKFNGSHSFFLLGEIICFSNWDSNIIFCINQSRGLVWNEFNYKPEADNLRPEASQKTQQTEKQLSALWQAGKLSRLKTKWEKWGPPESATKGRENERH